MSRLVDADELKLELKWLEIDKPVYHDVMSTIDKMATVDAVEVVRCKDCVHRFKDGENIVFNCCELNHNKVQADDWFCADGERREDETG